MPDKLTPVLDGEHHAALLLTCDGKDLQLLRDRAIILLFIDTGLCVSELWSLRANAIDLNTRGARGFPSAQAGRDHGVVARPAARQLDLVGIVTEIEHQGDESRAHLAPA